MDMKEALCQVAAKLGERRRFDARQIFGTRSGKHMIFPVGLGSALAKAVREGFLIVVGEGSRRRGKTYEMTPASVEFFRECAERPAPSALSMRAATPPVQPSRAQA